MLTRRHFARLFAGVALFVSAAAFAAWPERPIKIIVTFPPGGASDIVARLVADPLAAKLKQAVVVDNRPGAGGSVGGQVVMQAPPDGYTLMASNSTPLSVGPYALEKQPYDPIKDFTHIYFIGSTPVVIMATPQSGITSMADWVAKAKAAGGMNFGSGGPASIGHIMGQMIQADTGMKLTHVAYRGGAPMTADLLANVVPIGIDVITAYTPMIKDGKLKALAVSSRTRSALLPDVPSIAEAGYPRLVTENYFGISGPAKLPPEVVQTLYNALADVMKDPAVVKRMAELGITPVKMTPAEFTAYVQKQAGEWAPVIKASGVRL